MPRSKFNEPPFTGNSILDEYLLDLHNHVYGLGEDISGGLDDDNLSEDFPNLTEAETVSGLWTFSTHPLGLDHTKIANRGAYPHLVLDAHLDDSLLHVPAHLLALDPHTQYQKESEKGVASGYASLETDIKVKVAELRNPVWIGVSAPNPTEYPLWLDIS